MSACSSIGARYSRSEVFEGRRNTLISQTTSVHRAEPWLFFWLFPASRLVRRAAAMLRTLARAGLGCCDNAVRMCKLPDGQRVWSYWWACLGLGLMLWDSSSSRGNSSISSLPWVLELRWSCLILGLLLFGELFDCCLRAGAFREGRCGCVGD
jgi:hypothetical protein